MGRKPLVPATDGIVGRNVSVIENGRNRYVGVEAQLSDSHVYVRSTTGDKVVWYRVARDRLLVDAEWVIAKEWSDFEQIEQNASSPSGYSSWAGSLFDLDEIDKGVRTTLDWK